MNKKICAAISLLLCAVLLLSACAPSETRSAPPERFTGYVYDAFDTVITVTAWCSDRESFDALLAAAQSEFIRCHRMFDIYHPDPEGNGLYAVNANAGVAPLRVPAEIIELLKLAKEMYAVTDGCVNVAMGSVLRLWHDVREYNELFPDDPRLPDPEALREAALHRDIDALVIDEADGTVFLRDAEMRLDVGAIAKGYAAELVTELLASMGCESFVINAGGNIRTHGTKPDGSAWSIAVTDPSAPGGEPLGHVESVNGSVVTSGSYQRFFEYEGKRYHHIIDGKTLQPEDRYLAVTVLAENSGYADALSTALFNMEPEEGQSLVASLPDVEALWVSADGNVTVSEHFVLSGK